MDPQEEFVEDSMSEWLCLRPQSGTQKNMLFFFLHLLTLQVFLWDPSLP